MLRSIFMRPMFILPFQTTKYGAYAFKQCAKENSIVHQLYNKNIILRDFRRLYSEQTKPEEVIVDYDHVKEATKNDSILIVDVREPDEIKEHGKIPNSVNIPLGNVSTVLGSTTDEEFKKIYNRSKPTEDTEIIFYCMIGKRSGMAQQNAFNLGFRNVKNYVGSYTDWANKSH